MGNFFSLFFFCQVKKISNHVHRTFLEYFFHTHKKKIVEKIFQSSTMNILVLFFSRFLFFSFKNKFHACPGTCLVFWNFFLVLMFSKHVLRTCVGTYAELKTVNLNCHGKVIFIVTFSFTIALNYFQIIFFVYRLYRNCILLLTS